MKRSIEEISDTWVKDGLADSSDWNYLKRLSDIDSTDNSFASSTLNSQLDPDSLMDVKINRGRQHHTRKCMSLDELDGSNVDLDQFYERDEEIMDESNNDDEC